MYKSDVDKCTVYKHWSVQKYMMTPTFTLICCSMMVLQAPLTGDQEFVQSAALTKPNWFLVMLTAWIFLSTLKIADPRGIAVASIISAASELRIYQCPFAF